MDKAEEQNAAEAVAEMRSAVHEASRRFFSERPTKQAGAWAHFSYVAAALGIPLPVLAWCAANPETLAALAGGEMVAERKEVRNVLAQIARMEGDYNELGRVPPSRVEYIRAAWFQYVGDAPAKPQENHRDFGRDDTPPRGRFQDQQGRESKS